MKISHTYQTTTKTETLEPHMYIHTYSDSYIKNMMQLYKFNTPVYTKKYAEIRNILIPHVIDISIDRYMFSVKNQKKHLYIYTCPPSTMYIRGEKKIDSMMHLMQKSIQNIFQYIQLSTHSYLVCKKVFNIQHAYIKQKEAQHLGKNSLRKNRIRDLKSRYYISLSHKIYLLYCIHILRVQSFSYTIIDDISSTGATLSACKQTLMSYVVLIQKKHPHISYNIEICSLCH